MPDFLTIKRQHDAAKSKGLVPADSSIADFARMGALATDDPSYQQVAESPAWKNMIRSWSASADEAIQSGPVDDWTAAAFGAVGDVFGVTPEASRAAGRELPRQVLNFLPMMAGGAIGGLVGTPGGPAGIAAGAAKGGAIGMGLTSGLSAFDAYGKGGTTLDAVIGGASPYLGGKLSEFGSKAALRSAATPGSLLNRAGFMKGKDFLNPATHTVVDPVTGVAKQVLGETVDTFRDKALGYVAGEAIANIGFTGLDVIQQGPDAVLNRDYFFANLASNVPFALADLPNFTKTRFAWEPTDAPLRPTQDQINAEKTRAERTRESLDAVDNHLARFNKELELGVDVGRFIDTHNSVAATLEGHRKSVMLAAKEFKLDWDRHRTVKKTLPDILTGIDPAVLLEDPSVISFDPAKALVQEYAQKLKQLNKVKGGNLSRIAKSDTDLDYVMGLVEEDLRLPDTLLSTPVEQRTVEQYQKALGGKLSDNAIKLIRMKHMELAQGENFVPEFPKLWEEHNKALTGKFEGSIDDRYELITASLLATGKFPKVVNAQKKAVKEAKAEGQTNAEASKKVTAKLQRELLKAEKAEIKTNLKGLGKLTSQQLIERLAAAQRKATDASHPLGSAWARVVEAASAELAKRAADPASKPKVGAPKGPRKATLDKSAAMEERINRAAEAPSVKKHKFADNDAGPSHSPVDEATFLIAASFELSADPKLRMAGLSWLSEVMTNHAGKPWGDQFAVFKDGLKTAGRHDAQDENLVPLNTEVTPDRVKTPGEEADAEDAFAQGQREAMEELVADKFDEEDSDNAEVKPVEPVEVKKTPEQERDLLLRYLAAASEGRRNPVAPEVALAAISANKEQRAMMLEMATRWEQDGFPQLAARDVDPRTVSLITGQPLPIKEFATAWAREAGVPEAEIPAAVDDFIRITQMFAAGESRFGKLEVANEGKKVSQPVTLRLGNAYARVLDAASEVKILDLAVEQANQSRGEGGALLEKIKSDYPGRLITLVPSAKDKARQADLERFYESHGFTRDGNEYIFQSDGAQFARVFHGTPHKLPSSGFDFNKIGTGEGNAAQGHGIYLAQRESVAKYYRDLLSARQASGSTKRVEDRILDLISDPWSTTIDISEMLPSRSLTKPENEFLLALDKADWLGYDSPREAIIASLKGMLDDNPVLKSSLDKLRALGYFKPVKKVLAEGNLYEVDLKPNEDEFIDWDKAFSQQSASVKEKLAPWFLPEDTGKLFYERLSKELGSQKAASERLSELGIPGIKYFDAVSREKQVGTRNFVVFSPEHMTLLAENGQPQFAREGGTVYGAAFKDIAQAFFSTKAFQVMRGKDKIRAMAYDLAHEMSHLAYGKAKRGEYGEETRQQFEEPLAWVKTNDPAAVRDVEEVIEQLWLPKEFRNLDGVRDVLRNNDPEEWLANAHAMIVTGMVNANKPIKALLLLPKPIRTMVESTIRRVQDALKHARMYWKLSGDKNKMNQVLRVKAMVDSVRGKFREAEWQTAQAIKFLDVDSAGLWNRMQDAQFARSPYPTEGWSKQWVGKVFNNATMGLGGFMGTYKSFVEPGFLLQGSDRIVTSQVAESLTPIFGHKGAVDNIVIDKSLPWYKIADSPPLKDLAKRINLEAQDLEMSAFVQNPDGTVSFNWNAMSPKHRAEVKLYDPERQRLMATFLMQKEQSTRITQKNTVGHERARAKLFAVNLTTKLKSFDQGSAPAVRHKEARVVAERLFDAIQTGDQIAMQEAMSRFADPNEARKLVEIIQDKQADLAGLTKLYAERPNFQSLRRFKPIIQRYTNPAGESKVLDFNTGTESEAMKKDLVAKGWTPVGDVIIKEFDNKYKNEFTLDSKVVDLIEGKQGRLKDLINSIDMDPADRNDLLGESSFLEDVLRQAKSNEVYKPGVKRRISGGPEHLDMMEQHLTYTQAAHKVGYMTALGEELKYHMNNPELKDQHREKMQFMEFYKQAKDSDPKFWRTVNKAMAVWHIGGNLPGHLAELFQPFQTSIHQAVAQGHSMLTSLKTIVGAERDAARVAGKLIKSKIGYHDDAAVWVNWPDKDEAAMLKENYGRSITQSTQEIYQQVGVNQESLRSVIQDRTLPNVSKSLLKPFNMWANASMGFYSLFTQHNNLVGLLTGYRLAKKKGLSHEDAIKDARLFELTTNNSGGRTERPVYFGKLGHAGYLVYGLSSFVRGRFTDLAKYYRHGFDKVNFPELNQADRRAARKAFATMISGQLAAAGILGFPFIGPGLALMEDLTGEELKGSGMVALNEMTDDPLLTQALSYGVFSSMAEGMGIPADLHSRFALSGFLGVNAYDGVSASSVLGPTASMINSMWKMGKSLVQEHDLSKALQAGGPGGVKKMMEALSEDFQSENPDANLPMAMAGFRSGKMFKYKETERIISKTLEAAQNDIKIAAKKVEESLMLGPEVAQATLMREANLLIDQKLEGRGRQVALKDMMSNLRQRVALQKVKAQMPSDLRSKATAQTASKISSLAQVIGYQPPPAGNIEQEQIMRSIYGQLGGQRSATSLRNAARRQAELDSSPGTFY